MQRVTEWFTNTVNRLDTRAPDMQHFNTMHSILDTITPLQMLSIPLQSDPLLKALRDIEESVKLTAVVTRVHCTVYRKNDMSLC